MDAYFWHERWESNDIAFHQKEVNPQLVNYFQQLNLEQWCSVFLPLCGKTLDIGWLVAQGYHVTGAELNKSAIDQLFVEMGVQPEISDAGALMHYRAENIDIFVGDIFDLTGDQLGQVDAIYDRAALVALTEEMRHRYVHHLMAITCKAPQLLITYEYDQNEMGGPPFSISQQEIFSHYEAVYGISQLASLEVKGGLKGKCEAHEDVWLLRNR